jgi:hypothetical protein
VKRTLIVAALLAATSVHAATLHEWWEFNFGIDGWRTMTCAVARRSPLEDRNGLNAMFMGSGEAPSAQIVDKGEEVDVVFDPTNPFGLHRFFHSEAACDRTKSAWQAQWAAEDAAAQERDRAEDKYR